MVGNLILLFIWILVGTYNLIDKPFTKTQNQWRLQYSCLLLVFFITLIFEVILK